MHRAASHGLLMEASCHSMGQIEEAMDCDCVRVRISAITTLWSVLDEVPSAEQVRILIRGLKDESADVRRETLRCLLASSLRIENPELLHVAHKLTTDVDLIVKQLAKDLMQMANNISNNSFTSYQQRASVLQENAMREVKEKLNETFPRSALGLPTGAICLERDRYSFSNSPRNQV